MKKGLFWYGWHYAHAIERRMFLRYEWMLLRRAGIPVSEQTRREIWKTPGAAEDWVNLARFLSPAESVFIIDIGANIGEYADRVMREYRNSRAVCFEPAQANFRELQRRFAQNPSVELHNVALSNRMGEAEMFVGRSNTLCSLERYGSEADEAYAVAVSPDEPTETVRTRTLDSFSFDISGRKVLLKVDVQGHESSVLQGAGGTLKLADVVIIEVSFANEYQGLSPSFGEVTAMLRAAGLHPVVFQDYGVACSSYAFERDVIFVRENLLPRIWYANYGLQN